MILQRFIKRLPRFFERNPQPQAAIHFTGTGTVTVADLTLTLTTATGTTIVDLSSGTVQDVADAINADGYATATVVAFGGQLARGIIETSRQDIAIDPAINYPGSLLYQFFQTLCWELEAQNAQRQSASAQMSPLTAGDAWLDYWASFFGAKRYTGESDTAFAQRFINELVRKTQNNVALSIIVKETLGVDCTIRDAVPNAWDLPPEVLGDAPGRFLLEMGIDNSLTSDAAQALIDKIYAVVRANKASGTDFMQTVLRKLVTPEDDITVQEVAALLITAAVSDSLQPGPIRYGDGWRYGTPGLVYGNNDAVKEQVMVKKLLAADDSVVSLAMYGG